MHLRPADQLLAGQQLVIGEHLAVPDGLRDLHLGGHRQRHRTGGDHAHPQLGRGVQKHVAMPLQLIAQPLEGVDDTAVHFDDTALQFRDVRVRQSVEQLGRAGSQPAGFQIDKVEFLFDA